MTDQRWYYELLTEEFGPVDLSVIRGLVADGTLGATDRVRLETSEQWITAAELPAEDDAVDHDDYAEDRHSDLDIDAFTFEENETDRHSDLDIDAFNLQSDGDSPQPELSSRHRPVPEPEPEDDEEPTYYVQSIGEILGPLLQSELLEMASVGTLTRGDEIREGEDGRWIPIEALAGVGGAVMENQATQDAEAEARASERRGAAAASKKRARRKPTKSKTPPGKKRRKRRKKKDEFLAEIFAEVFNDEGKLRHEKESPAPAPAPPAPASAAPTADAAEMVGADPGASAGMPGQPMMNQPVPGMSPGIAPGMSPGMAAGGAMGQSGMPAAPPPKFTPPPKFVPPKKAKSSSSGGGFELPEPKVLGMIGGGAALVLLLVLGFMGIVPLPGFGVNPESFLKDFNAEYVKNKNGSAEEWKAMRDSYAPTARQVAKDLAPVVGTDPTAKKQQQAALKVISLLSKPHDDKEAREKAYEAFTEAMSGQS